MTIMTDKRANLKERAVLQAGPTVDLRTQYISFCKTNVGYSDIYKYLTKQLVSKTNAKA